MMIWRRRRYAIAVVSLLTLIFIGVGTVLGILSTSVLRPLPFTEPKQLFRAMRVDDGDVDIWPLEEFRRTVSLTAEIEEAAALTPAMPQVVSFRGDTATGGVTLTTANFFRVLGIRTRAYDVPGAAIVSRALVRRLGLSRDSAIGKSLRVGDDVVTIVDVIDRTRAFPTNSDVWFASDRAGVEWMGVVRARGNVPLDVVSDRMSRAYQVVKRREGGPVRVMIQPLGDMAGPLMSGTQRMLIAGIAIFAIIAILNYGLLGIGDARRRAQEFAVRVAVGGTRAQVMWGLFRDQLLLVAAALLLAVGVLLPVGLRAYEIDELAKALLQLDHAIWLLLLGTLALLVGAAALPTRISTNTPEIEVLRRVSARASRVESAWNRAFVSVQFGVTSFLVVVGTVALLGVLRDRQTRYGFDEHNAVLGWWWSLPKAHRDEPTSALITRQFSEQVQRAFPGRATIWTSSYRAMAGGKYRFGMEPGVAPEKIITKGGGRGIPWVSEDVAPSYFDVLGIRIVRGRAFSDADNATSQPVAIVTEKAARVLWGTLDVVGHRVRFGEDDGEWRTVVGVAADAYPVELATYNFQSRGALWPLNFMYRPLAQTGPRGGFKVLVRGGDEPAASATLATLLDRIVPGEEFRNLLPFSKYLDWSGDVSRGESASRTLFGFAICGLLLGLVGAMILIDDIVRSRTTEFGIRRALGAPAGSLVALASRETVAAGLAGIVAGGLVGARLGPVVTAWLKATPGRPLLPPEPSWTIVGALIAGLGLVLIGGTMLRAIRAARLDPATALRIT